MPRAIRGRCARRLPTHLLLGAIGTRGGRGGRACILEQQARGHERRREKRKVAPYVFTGIQIVSKRLLEGAPEGKFSTNILWDRAIEQGRLFGTVHQGLWFDVGRPQSIGQTEAALQDE